MPNTWPFGLTDTPDTEGYQELPAKNAIREEMDSGPPSLRRVATSGPKQYNCQFSLTTAEVATFETFYVTTLSDGTDEYQWNDPRTGVQYDWKFAADPVISPLGGDNWLLQCQLWRLV